MTTLRNRTTWTQLLAVTGIILSAQHASADLATNETRGATTMPEVVVAATRNEQPADEAPARVTVVKRQEIEARQVETLDNALRHESGIYVNRKKGLMDPNALNNVVTRGLSGQSRTLVLLDGLPVNSGYDGNASWNKLAIGNVDRMEFIRGPGSALYGGNAMGGMINIITELPKELEWGAAAGFGSYDTLRYSAFVGDHFTNGLSFRLGYEREETQGYPTTPVNKSLSAGVPNLYGGSFTTTTAAAPRWTVGDYGDNTAERWNTHLELGYDVTETGKLKLASQYGHYEYGYEQPHTYLFNALGIPSMNGKAAAGAGQIASVTPSTFIYYTGPGEEDYYRSALSYEDQVGEIQLKLRTGFQMSDQWYSINTATGQQNYDNAPGQLTPAVGRSWFGDFQVTLPVANDHQLTTGFYFRYDDFDQDTYSLSYYRDTGSRIAKLNFTGGADCSQAVYVQDEWRVMPRLVLYGGVRVDYWQTFDGRSGSVTAPVKFEERDDYAISPKFSPVWQAFDDTYLRASISRAFRPPNLYELYRTWTSGTTTYNSNPNLEPETLWNYEFGFDQYAWKRKIKVSGTYFHSDLSDAIGTTMQGTQRLTENISEASLDGVELECSVTPWDWLRVWGNYTYVETNVDKNDVNPTAVGKRLTDVPDTTINVGTDVGNRWFKVSMEGHYVGRIYTTDANTDLADLYGGYSTGWLWDVRVSSSPVKHLTLALAVENVFDRNYYSYSIGRGRTFFGEVRYRW